MFVAIVMEQFEGGRQCALSMAAKEVLRIHDLIYPDIDFLVQIMVRAEGVSVNGLSIIVRRRGVFLRGFTC